MHVFIFIQLFAPFKVDKKLKIESRLNAYKPKKSKTSLLEASLFFSLITLVNKSVEKLNLV